MKRRDPSDAPAGDSIGERLEQALAGSLRPAAIEPDRAARLRARVMARVRAESAAPRELVTVRSSEGDWTRIQPGIERKLLFEDPGTRTRSVLIRLGPGARIEPHGHGVHEECLVLDGELRIGDTRLRAGDYHLAAAGVPHDVVQSEAGALIFLREEMRELPGG
jgi:quercetin dioxygenase-like cupin family protein